MIAVALALLLAGPPEPAARPLVLFVEHFGSGLTGEHSSLALAAACRRARPVTILARRRGHVQKLSPEGVVLGNVPRANLHSALGAAFQEAGKGADVVYFGATLPRTRPGFDTALASLRKSGATFHGVSFASPPDDGMRVLAEQSGGEVWIASPAGALPEAAVARLCR